jgi:predicted ArsR family transcriptional regulator
MSKQKMKDNEQIIIQLREEGKSRQEIADILGLTKEQIKRWVTRYNRRQKKQATGIPARPKGRPRKDYALTEENTVEYYKRQFRLAKSENNRLKMENELLRDFLSLTGKG